MADRPGIVVIMISNVSHVAAVIIAALPNLCVIGLLWMDHGRNAYDNARKNGIRLACRSPILVEDVKEKSNVFPQPINLVL